MAIHPKHIEQIKNIINTSQKIRAEIKEASLIGEGVQDIIDGLEATEVQYKNILERLGAL